MVEYVEQHQPVDIHLIGSIDPCIQNCDKTHPATIFLDNSYPSIRKDSQIVLKSGLNITLYKVDNPIEQSEAWFNVSGKTTSIDLQDVNGSPVATSELDGFSMRTTIVFSQPESLLDKLAEVPIDNDATTGQLILNQQVDGLSKGQLVAISDSANSQGPQIAMIKDVTTVSFDEEGNVVEPGNADNAHDAFTQISLDWLVPHSPPQYTDWSIVSVDANVAKATHGETKQEILGSGIQVQQMQEFVLKQSPLTYVPDSTPSGGSSTLEIQVSGISWNEIPSLYGLGGKDSNYITRMDEDGKTHVIFGDGTHGRLLPNGQNNITATYRVGIGTAGMVNANQISLPMIRPLGLKKVTNPLPSVGAQDPEQINEARQNATLTLQTLDRIVSLADFENYAVALSGIGKAQANSVWDGHKQVVHITIAPAVETDSNDPSLTILLNTFMDSVNKYKDPLISVKCDLFAPKPFSIDVSILVAGDRNCDDVKAEVENTLYNNFSYSAMTLGKSLSVSEILAKIQEVDGIVSAYVNSITVGSTVFASPGVDVKTTYIPANAVTYNDDIVPADLLFLKQGGVILSNIGGDSN